MADIKNEISVIGVVLFIAGGIVVFVLGFIFAKRQISRLALKTSQKSIGAGAPKVLKKQIQERLNQVSKMKYEPVLMNSKLLSTPGVAEANHFVYRMKAVDAFSKFDEAIKSANRDYKGRHPNMRVRWYLAGLSQSFLDTCPIECIYEFADIYEHARHRPEPFGEKEYNNYMKLLDQLIQSLKVGLEKDSKTQDKSKEITDTFDSKVLYDKNKRNKIKTEVIHQKNSTEIDSSKKSRKIPGDLRFRSRTGSSGHSSLLDSGRSSQPSSEITDRESTEHIALVDFSVADNEHLV